tara:strand:+ start:114 stop:467 length:354 start_codon:yes stop_codon:yes gene_type:complete
MTRWIFPAVEWAVYDGDTISATVDLGFGVRFRLRGRLDGINTPELRGPERADGLVARDWLKDELAAADSVRIATRGGSGRQTGKYGRWLITLWVTRGGIEENLNEQMVRDGVADVYQ